MASGLMMATKVISGLRSMVALELEVAARDIDQAARGVVRAVGHQPEDGVGHFLGPAAALHGHVGRQALDAVGLSAAGVDAGLYQAGPHGVHAYALGGDFLGQAQRHHVQRALGGRIVHVLARCAQPRSDAGDVHDGATPSAMAGAHAPHGLARADEAADGIDTEHAHYKNIDKKHLIEFETLHCEGIMAGTGATEKY